MILVSLFLIVLAFLLPMKEDIQGLKENVNFKEYILFSYAQILSTRHKEHDIVSTFAFFNHNQSFQECDRTVYGPLKWYPDGTQSSSQMATGFGIYAQHTQTFILCLYVRLCYLTKYLDLMKQIQWFDFQPTALLISLEFKMSLYYYNAIGIQK